MAVGLRKKPSTAGKGGLMRDQRAALRLNQASLFTTDVNARPAMHMNIAIEVAAEMLLPSNPAL